MTVSPVVATVNGSTRSCSERSPAAAVELDEAPREVEVPVDLAAALAADPQAAASFEQMAFTHRKEYARWIAEAKRDETRQRRVAQGWR